MMDKLNARSMAGAVVLRGAGNKEVSPIKGTYIAKCYDKDGNLKWEDKIDNLVTDVGANELLNLALGGSGTSTYFLGLISSVGYTAVAAGDTMASHTGWNEAGNGVNYPNWDTPASNARAAITWSAAAARSKAISSAASFTIATNGGTVKGCFIVFSTGAVATNNDTNGVLFSAGLFSGGDKVVADNDTLQVSYSVGL